MTATASMNQPQIQRLLEIMRRLRDPADGCPWDREQDFDSIAPYTIEEAYEVADAIDRRDFDELKGELGDLLFQVVYHAQMADEEGYFAFADVLAGICDKLIRRHPHVFGEATLDSAQALAHAWEESKARERSPDGDVSALAGLTRGLPEWARALKLHERAARVGFDWPDAGSVLDKIAEELSELDQVVRDRAPAARVEEELGDLLFAAIALARHAGVDPGRALRRANLKFERRFRALEALAAEREIPLAEAGIQELDRLWDEVKERPEV